ncbi:LytR/AlgR family response regulator transcription factor [Tenacibaculum sp. M341]|uniref:LytR/AlgR family response regulator transcription factor n=1 Tax=Tenacibaculum sp. M341 TaxID=2530339 RepID=UPI00104D166B|nr:LytTR family DNA-binding domain-containing protein [Tenacibaculum sp. M341]TCI85260.1 response regulator transcription factor [Tenacibaculum sp. M341]
MPLKCLLVDDEPLAIKLLENHIAKIDSLEVVATCNSAIKAFEKLNTETVDVLFLDIKMPQLTGIDFLKTLKNPPKTILTTAYRDYATESYDLEVIDYLLKPITFERFLKATDKLLRNNKTVVFEPPKQVNEFIFIKSGNKHHKVFTNDILYIESLKDYIKIHLSNDKRIVAKYKISDIEHELRNKDFLRTHRSYLLNTEKITAFSTNNIEIDSVEIPIGVSYRDEVTSFLKSFKE